MKGLRRLRRTRLHGQPSAPCPKFAEALGLPADASYDDTDARIEEIRALGYEVVNRGYLDRVELAAAGPEAFAGFN